MDNTQDMLFIFVKIISLIKRVGYLGYFVTILGFGYFTKPHHPAAGFEITFRKYVQFCRLFFVGENFCRLFSKRSLVMFWSEHRPNNSDVNHSLSKGRWL